MRRPPERRRSLLQKWQRACECHAILIYHPNQLMLGCDYRYVNADMSVTSCGIVHWLTSDSWGPGKLEFTRFISWPAFDGSILANQECRQNHDGSWPATTEKRKSHFYTMATTWVSSLACELLDGEFGWFCFSQLRDFLLVYNRMTEICFQRCTSNFNYRNLTMDEVRILGIVHGLPTVCGDTYVYRCASDCDCNPVLCGSSPVL